MSKDTQNVDNDIAILNRKRVREYLIGDILGEGPRTEIIETAFAVWTLSE